MPLLGTRITAARLRRLHHRVQLTTSLCILANIETLCSTRSFTLASKSTLRVTINCDGTEELLFTIKEIKSPGNDGGLLIYAPRSGYYEDGFSGILERTREVRMSVHASPSTLGHTIIDHIKIGSDDPALDRYKAAAYVELNNDCPFWLLSSIVPGLPISSTTSFQSRKGEMKASLGTSKLTNTLAIQIWLSRIEIPFFETNSNYVHHDFSIFRITIAWDKLIVPPMHEGYRSFFATSARQVDGVKDGWEGRPDLEGLSQVAANVVSTFAKQKLSAGLYRVHRRKMIEGGMQRSMAWETLSVFCCTATDDSGDAPQIYLVADPRVIESSSDPAEPIRQPEA